MMISVNLLVDDYKCLTSLEVAGCIALDILKQVRAQKTSLKVSVAAPVSMLNIIFDRPNGYDHILSGYWGYDLMGATKADKIALRSMWGPNLDTQELYKEWHWDSGELKEYVWHFGEWTERDEILAQKALMC